MSVHFVVQTFDTIEGRKIRSMKPDSDGYFIGVPIAVIGIPSRNRAFYDVNSFKQAMEDPTSIIRILLTDGNLFGEWGHPKLATAEPDEAFLRRLTEIYEDRQSHHFRKIYTAETLESCGTIVRADLKPTGPFKEQHLEQLMDPNINSAYSLRSICHQTYDRSKNLLYRTIKKLVTFDAVSCGGYQQASKRWAPATEAIDSYELNLINALGIENQSVYATEAIKDLEILKIFDAKEMVWRTESLGIKIPDAHSYLDNKGHMRSVFHQMVQRR